MAGEAGAADAVFVQQLRERFGLDRSFPEQLALYLRGILTFDLGWSYRQNRSVASLIGERLPATLLLTGAAFLISLALGILLGALAAARSGRFSDRLIGLGRARLLRDASVLDRADEPDRVLAQTRAPAQCRLRDDRGGLHRFRSRCSTSADTSFCPPRHWGCSSRRCTRA
jgi:hypothetical protein